MLFVLLSIKIEVFLINSSSSLIRAFYDMDCPSKAQFLHEKIAQPTSKELSFVFWWCWWAFVGANITEEDAGFELHVAMSSTLAVIVITRQRYFMFYPLFFFFWVSSKKSCLFSSIWHGSDSLEHAEQTSWSSRTRSPGCWTCNVPTLFSFSTLPSFLLWH